MHKLNALFLFFSALFILDFYFYQGVRVVFNSSLAKTIYWAVTLIVYIIMIYSLFKIFVIGERDNRMLLHVFGGCFILFYLPKLVGCVFLLIEDIWRLIIWSTKKLALFSDDISILENRRKFISQIALGIAGIPFFLTLFGVIRGRYKYQVIKKILEFEELPISFDGFKITQISDLHCGSFSDLEELKRAIDLINGQQSDVVLFTGDLINNQADELLPWMDVLGDIQGKEGVYSVLGNHDYGDYYPWENEDQKTQNFEDLKNYQKKIGFKLMLNDSITLKRGKDCIYLVGVENWGSGRFQKYGNLKKAMKSVPEGSFTILMSHDPSHFDQEILHFDKHIHLTLSGHTHGMQFGIEIPGFIKWSPVQYRYKKWAGLYEERNKFIYVNRGLGFIGFPGRVGIWPEITVLELRKKKKKS